MCSAQHAACAGSVLSNKLKNGQATADEGSTMQELHIESIITLQSQTSDCQSLVLFFAYICTASLVSIICQENPYIVPFGHYIT